jgi:hypothetical protein
MLKIQKVSNKTTRFKALIRNRQRQTFQVFKNTEPLDSFYPFFQAGI